MASKTFSLLLKSQKLSFYSLSSNSRSLWLTTGTNHQRAFASGETKEIQQDNPTESQPIQTSENEKKLQIENETLTESVNNLKEKNDELLDKYKRSLADSENLRNRLTKQIEDARIFGIQGFCKDLLEVADILGHATNAVPKDEIPKNDHLKNLFDGLVMTKDSLLQVFKRHGLEQVNPIQQKFDPNLHEALFQIEDKTAQPNIVIEVSKVGYKLKERCIRPALVGVSK